MHTLINVIEVDPARQQDVIALLQEATDAVIRHRPGLISVRILASTDGTRVVNQAEWQRVEDIKATLADPAVQAFAKRLAELGTPSPSVYRLVSS